MIGTLKKQNLCWLMLPVFLLNPAGGFNGSISVPFLVVAVPELVFCLVLGCSLLDGGSRLALCTLFHCLVKGVVFDW